MGGGARARNLGLAMATGNLIYFMDADDEIDHQLLMTMNQLFLEHPQADFCVFSYHYLSSQYDYIEKMKDDILSGAQFRKQWLTLFSDNPLAAYYPWNKMFRRQFIQEHQLTFPEGQKYGEDGIFCLNAYNCAREVILSSFVGYEYLKTEDSQTATLNMNHQRFTDEMKLSKKIKESLISWHLSDQLANDRMLWAIFYYLHQHRKDISRDEKQEIRYQLKTIVFPKSLKKKIQYLLCYVLSF